MYIKLTLRCFILVNWYLEYKVFVMFNLKIFATVSLLVLLVGSISTTSLQKFNIRPRIINGENAKVQQFPYMISLRHVVRTFYGQDEYKHFCGAALISDRWVISAAHCLHNKTSKTSNIRIVAAAHHFWRDGEMYEVKKIIRHERFQHIYKENDIALLQTKLSVVFSEGVQAIAISKGWVQPGQDGVFPGFGVTGA